MLSDVNVLRTYIYNEEYRKTVQEHLRGYMFLDAHCRDLFELIDDYMCRNAKFPDKNLEILVSNNPWQQDREQIKEKFTIMKIENPTDYSDIELNDVLKSTEEWIRHRMFGYFLQTGVSMFQKQSIDQGEINSWVNKINSFTFEKTDVISNVDDDYMYELITTDLPRLSFTWPVLNKMLKGGVYYKSLNVFQGGTHAGKSRLLASLATDVIRQSSDNEILYVTLEQPKENFLMAFEQHLTGMPIAKLKELARHDKQKWMRLRGKMKDIYGITHVKEGSSSRTSALAVRNLVDDFLQKGHNIKAVFVDYLQILKPLYPVNNLYEKGDVNALDIRAIAQDLETPMFSVVQPGREGNRKNQKIGAGADMMDVGESKAIPDHSDLYGNIICTPEMYKNDRQILYFHKNRHGHEVHKSVVLEIKKELYQVEFLSEFEEEQREEADQPMPSEDSFDIPDFSKPLI